jgi:hypothetical protein
MIHIDEIWLSTQPMDMHARRKFHELHVTGKSQIAEQALRLIQKD